MVVGNYTKSTVLHGWHPGELRMQRKMGYDQAPGLDQMWQYIYAEMTEQQRTFHTSNLHFLPVVTLDATGRPWSSILAAGNGRIGWIKSIQSGRSRFQMKPKVWVGDPLWENVGPFGEEDNDGVLFAGIGVEVATRRRNKMAGKIKTLVRNEENREVTLTAHVYESTGNCPKYITIRSVEPHPDTHPLAVYDTPEMTPTDRLPSDIISFIHAADTIWLGSVFSSSSPDYPSHLGINHRGGRPGWVRVKPSDGRTLVLPDWSGNRFMSTLGNIEATPFASVTIVDWNTGDILYLTGDAANRVGKDAEEVMPMQHALTELKVTGYRFVKDALPVRQKEGVEIETSPYNPPVKLLREELEAQGVKILGGGALGGAMPQAKLEKFELHSPTIATFTFRPSVPLRIRPGQAIIMDFKKLLGTPKYRHMAADKPSSVNDDFIRTWTVSSYHPPLPSGKDGNQGEAETFDLTMKEKEGGLVTGVLFQFARWFTEEGTDPATQNLQAGIVGISGDFYLNLEPAGSPAHSALLPRRLVWAAGGIGVTPFITMLRALMAPMPPSVSSQHWDIVFLLSTREPDVLLPLIAKVYRSAAVSNVRLSLHVFTNVAVPKVAWEFPCDPTVHKGRLGVSWFKQEKEALEGREAFLCGTPAFENVVLDALVQEVGLKKEDVQKEGFAY